MDLDIIKKTQNWLTDNYHLLKGRLQRLDRYTPCHIPAPWPSDI